MLTSSTNVTEKTESGLSEELVRERGPVWVWRLGAVAVLIAGVLFVLSSGAWRSSTGLAGAGTLPVIAVVPPFSLLERSGQTVTQADLLGQVWVADFIFTRCPGPCPTLSAKMRGLQFALKDHAEFKLVSICLDPKNDTPAALGHYAKRFQAEPDRWWFLTGSNEREIHALVQKGFLQSVVPASEGEPILHSTYLVVVDRKGRIRAAHEGLEADASARVIRDVERLLAELDG